MTDGRESLLERLREFEGVTLGESTPATSSRRS
jgi:hypothetical protein